MMKSAEKEPSWGVNYADKYYKDKLIYSLLHARIILKRALFTTLLLGL